MLVKGATDDEQASSNYSNQWCSSSLTHTCVIRLGGHLVKWLVWCHQPHRMGHGQHLNPKMDMDGCKPLVTPYCPACRTSLIATRFWVVVICPIIKCLTVLEFSFILFDLCLFITIFNFILNYVPIVTSWVFTYHKILILLIIFCFIWNYWIIYFLTYLEVFWSVVR